MAIYLSMLVLAQYNIVPPISCIVLFSHLNQTTIGSVIITAPKFE